MKEDLTVNRSILIEACAMVRGLAATNGSWPDDLDVVGVDCGAPWAERKMRERKRWIQDMEEIIREGKTPRSGNDSRPFWCDCLAFDLAKKFGLIPGDSQP